MARSNIEPTLETVQNMMGEVTPELEISDEEEIEVEIEDEDSDLLEDEEEGEEVEEGFLDNLAERIDEETLDALSDELIELYKVDKESRAEWDSIAADAIKQLGFSSEETDVPFPGACEVTHPMLAQSVVKFQAKAFRELFPSQGPVRTRIMGDKTREREQQAFRVRDYMNYQTTVLMSEYGPELDRLLFSTALYGSAFKKTYYDATMDRPVSKFIKAEDFVIDYFTESLETSPRYTHKYEINRDTIVRHQVAGVWRDIELSDKYSIDETSEIREVEDEVQGRKRPAYSVTDDEMHLILEMHVDLDLPGYEHEDGLRLPYIVTIDKNSGKILAIYRNWKEGDPKFKKRVWFTHYCFVPGLGFYGYGYLHLIGGLVKTATSNLRQLVDAGTFANLPAGFKAHGLRVLAPDGPIEPGEWREVNAPAGDIAKSLVPLPYKEPSQTLFSLLQFMIDAAREFADSTEQVVSESTNYGPVGTTLALLEQSGKLYSAIHYRMHMAQAHDLKLLAEINFEYMPDAYPFDVAGASRTIFKADFDPASVDVIPVSDPNMPTEAHRVAKLNAIMTFAASDPQAHNMREIRLDLYTAMGIENPERYLAPPPEEVQPLTADPMSENAAAIIGKPIRPRLDQNHEAHIKAHAAILADPSYSQNAMMQQVLMAHINEHLSMKYTMEMLEMIGEPDLTQAMLQGQPLPPEIENMVAVKVAETSDAVLRFNELKAKALAGDNEDPALKLQKDELQLKLLNMLLDHNDKQVRNAIDAASVDVDAVKEILKDMREQAQITLQQRLATRREMSNEDKSGTTV